MTRVIEIVEAAMRGKILSVEHGDGMVTVGRIQKLDFTTLHVPGLSITTDKGIVTVSVYQSIELDEPYLAEKL